MDSNPFRNKQRDKLAESMQGMALNPEDDPEQQPPPYSLPEPQATPASGSGYGYSQYTPAPPPGQAYDQLGERSLPGLPGEASTYYQTSAQVPAGSSQRPIYTQTPGGPSQLAEGAPKSSSSNSLFSSLSSSFSPGPKRNPLDPPPPAFTRPIAYLDPRPFPPLSLQSFKASLQDGFPAVPAAPEGPLPPGAPHPFSTHDIPEADWLRFLEDITIVAKLTGTEKATSRILPMAIHVALPGGFLISRGIKKMMSGQKVEDVAGLVESWNQFFFQPRHVRAILTQGGTILTTPEGGHSQATIAALSAYGTQHGGNHGHRRDSSSSSSSSSDSDDERHRHGHNQGQQHFQGQPMSRRDEKAARRAAKREYREQRRELRGKRREDRDAYRAERRALRQERRDSKRGRRGDSSNEKYRIILVPC